MDCACLVGCACDSGQHNSTSKPVEERESNRRETDETCGTLVELLLELDNLQLQSRDLGER